MFRQVRISHNAKRFRSIFALSSGSLPAALAIIRISGNESGEALLKLTGKPTKFEPHKLFYTPIYDDKRQILDRAMAVFFKGPKSFTGEDTVELYVHGSRAVVDSILRELAKFPGLEPAKAGDFTKRAFFNSKLNVSQVEALGDLLNAETSTQLQLAHKQNEAAKQLEPIRTTLIKLIARLNAAIDFAEDMESQQSRNWKLDFQKEVDELRLQLLKLLNSTRKGMLIRSGVRVALIGQTNVGKSSLMNRLASRDVAIVSKIHGTTRDSLEVRVSLANLPVTVTDTAGLRQTNDELEKEGILRSIKRSSEANIVIFVLSAERLQNGRKIEDEIEYLKRIVKLPKHVEILICINKSDLLSDEQKSQLKGSSKLLPIFASTLIEDGIQSLVDALSQQIQTASEDYDGQELFLSRERHVHLLQDAIQSLDEFQGSFNRDTALAAQNLHDALLSIGEIAGTVVNERILDEIFSQFCIGK